MATPGDVVQHRSGSSWRRTFGCLWREARPVVQVVFLFRLVVGCAVGTAHGGSLGGDTVLMGLAWPAVVLGVYLGNGVSDLRGDVANGSVRPLAAGRLDPHTALCAAVLCSAAGLGAAAATGSAVLLLVTALMVALGWLYSYGARPLKDGALTAALTFVGGGLLTYLAGALSTGAAPGPDALAVLVLLSAWMGVGGSAKDLADVAGDALAGRRTLPVLLGARRAARLLAAGCLLLAGCATAVALGGSRHWLPALVLAAGAVVVALRLSAGTADRAGSRRGYRTFMVVQYAANLGFLASCTIVPTA